jgi:hypothetical protein
MAGPHDSELAANLKAILRPGRGSPAFTGRLVPSGKGAIEERHSGRREAAPDDRLRDEAIHIFFCHSGMVRKHQTRNLEIPGRCFASPRNDGGKDGPLR